MKSSHYRFSPHGISLFAIISASHIAIHTWPEYGFLNIDIFSCNQNCLPEASLSDLISERIATQEIDIQVIDHYINV